jgi:DNA-binding CsgD family transcriptional regulator
VLKKKQMSNETIARKLKISPGAVSQRKAKIQQLLDSTDSDV